MGRIELLPLGVGDAESSVYRQVSSTSFIVLLDGFPVLLIGAGGGCVSAAMHYAHLIPEHIILLSSTLEQTAELAPLLLGEISLRRRLKIFGSADVIDVVKSAVGLLLRDKLDLVEQFVSFVRVPLNVASTSSSSGTAVGVGAAPLPQPQPGTSALTLGTPNSSVGPPGGFHGNTLDPVSVVLDFSILLQCAMSHQTSTTAGLSAPPIPIATPLVLCFRDFPVVALSGPTSFDVLLYAKLCHCPFVAVWAQHTPTRTRSSVHELVLFADKVNSGRKVDERVLFLLTGYNGGSGASIPMVSGYVFPLQPGVPIVLLSGDQVQSSFGPLNLPLPNVKKSVVPRVPPGGKTSYIDPGLSSGPTGGGGIAGSSLSALMAGKRSSSRGSPVGGMKVSLDAGALAAVAPSSSSAFSPKLQLKLKATGESERRQDPSFRTANAQSNSTAGDKSGIADARRVFVYSNEDKGRPGRLFLLKNFRSSHQLESKVAEVFSLKPLKGLYFPDGAALQSLSELRDLSDVIAVRRGGTPFDVEDLPRQLRRS